MRRLQTLRWWPGIQQGFTLIEMMVALFLGGVLLAGVLQIFSNSKKTYKTQEALARVQENGRFAMFFLTQDIRQAGYRGDCVRNTLVNTTLLDGANAFLFDFNTPIQGFNATSAMGATPKTWAPSLDATFPSSAASAPSGGSDIITIRKADNIGYSITANNSATWMVQLASNSTMANCNTAIVTDCSTAVVFHVNGISPSSNPNQLFYKAGKCKTTAPSGNVASPSMASTYIGGQLYPINTVSYYIRPNPNNNPALYRKTGINDAEELVEGIEQMQILYGVDTNVPPDGTANYYVTAANVANWQQVVSVRISLLAVSLENNVTDKPVSYVYNGATITPPANDKRIRRTFTSTIALRNRLP